MPDHIAAVLMCTCFVKKVLFSGTGIVSPYCIVSVPRVIFTIHCHVCDGMDIINGKSDAERAEEQCRVDTDARKRVSESREGARVFVGEGESLLAVCRRIGTSEPFLFVGECASCIGDFSRGCTRGLSGLAWRKMEDSGVYILAEGVREWETEGWGRC